MRWARVEGCGEVCVFLSWGVHLPPNKHVPTSLYQYLGTHQKALRLRSDPRDAVYLRN